MDGPTRYGPGDKLSSEADLVVLGSGAGGLTAALTAVLAGLRPVVLEHAEVIGGTSARSSGSVWVPDNPYLREMGVADDREKAERYLGSLVGNRGEAAMWRAFLDGGPLMLAQLAEGAGIRFRPLMASADYRQDHPGAASGGRALEPLAFDGRSLGADFRRLAAPLRELMLFGGLMVSRAEAAELLRADRSPKAALMGLRMLARYLKDRLRHPRGTRLVLGNALVARLLKALLDRQVPVFTGIGCRRLHLQDGKVAGVDLSVGGTARRLNARRGVILAGGGFPANAAWRARELPSPVPAYTPAFEGCDGSTMELALATGAALGPDGLDNGLWFPSSIARRADGSTAVYPHIVLDRAKPGLMAVNHAGERFVNEAVSYHEFVRAMYRADARSPTIPAWLVCDRNFVHRYGLGLIRPRTPGLRRYVRSGYLHQGATLVALAGEIGVPAAALEDTVRRFNGFAANGVDADFGKGGNAYDCSNGDPAVQPNPCLGPIASAPFYAVAVVPTPLGTSRGLSADVHARVLDAAGKPVPGLYVCGNDMQSAFGGEYPGAGGQLGQAMTFGWIAARHAANLNSNSLEV